MGVHRDPKSGEEWEPLNEHATFRLGIDYGFRNAFKEGQPMSRAGYELMSNNGGAFAYFTAPPYEEYLRLCDMYSRTQRLRAEGLSGIDAAEAVRKRGLSDHIPLDQASFEKVGIHPDL